MERCMFTSCLRRVSDVLAGLRNCCAASGRKRLTLLMDSFTHLHHLHHRAHLHARNIAYR